MRTAKPPHWLVSGDERGERTHEPHDPLEAVLAELPIQAAIIRGGDLRIIYVNPAYQALSPGRPLVGQTVDEAWPEAGSRLAERCQRVLSTGEPFRIHDEPYRVPRPDDGTVEPRYFSWSLHRVALGGDRGWGLVSVVWETTDRKLGEEARTEAQERQTYLLRLADALRELTDPDEILAVASRLLGRHLGVQRVAYATVHGNEAAVVRHDFVDGLPSLAGTVSIAVFGDAVLGPLRRGEELVVEDVETDPRLGDSERAAFRAAGIGSTVTVSLIKDGRWVGVLGVHHAGARRWRSLDRLLVQETADRTWAALVQAQTLLALRRSEEHQAFLLGLSDAIRPLREPTAILTEAARLLRRHLHADRVCVVRLPTEPDDHRVRIEGEDHSPGLPDLAASHAPQDLPRDLGDWVSVPADHPGPRVVGDALAQGALPLAQQAAHRAIGCGAFITVPLLDDDRPVALLSVHQRVRRSFGEADVTLAVETAERAWGAVSRARAERAVQRSERRLRALIEGIPQLVWRASDDGRFSWSSPQWTALTGLSRAASRELGWLAAVHPDDREAALDAWSTARDSGRLEMETRLYDATEGRYRWFRTRATPVRDPSARIVEWLGTSTDVDELRRLRDHQDVLVAELQHRTRNLMGVVDAIARETIQNSEDLETFAVGFRKRVSALSRAQSLLSRLGEGQRVSFDTLLRSELGSMFCDEHRPRVALEGPPGVSLRSSSVQILALALHELATNALKHGALSRSDGRLTVRWWVEARDGQDWLCIDWRETGVGVDPDDVHPRRRGQGRSLIERKLPYQLDAKTSWTLTADGVHCSIAVPFPPRRADDTLPPDPRPPS